MKTDRVSIFDEKGVCLGFVPAGDDPIIEALQEMGFTLRKAQICEVCHGMPCPVCKGAGYVSNEGGVK